MRILGISAFYHDSAAALIEDGRILAAAQEERFTRKKFDNSFPHGAIAYCLAEGGYSLNDVDSVFLDINPAHGNKDLPESFSFKHVQTIEHHVAQAAAAFYPSPYEEAAILIIGGNEGKTTTVFGMGQSHKLSFHKKILLPHSLGLLYSAFTGYLGFKPHSGEYKVMGLAPYGAPRFAQLILDIVVDSKAKDFRLDQSFVQNLTDYAQLASLFGHGARNPDQDQIASFHMDIAASIQAVTERIVLDWAQTLRKDTGATRLCLGGNVALNCVANGKIFREKIFEDIWIQPASGDAGCALGAALAGHYFLGHSPRVADNLHDAMQGAYLGPSFTQKDIETRLATIGAKFSILENGELFESVAQALSEQKIVGWMQGRMEFGPRALGNRSILSDPRLHNTQSILNRKVKRRESFRPFAPSVLCEDVNEWFDLNKDSPYMLLVTSVNEKHRRILSAQEQALSGLDRLKAPRSDIPAVTHIDNSARIQTVAKNVNPRYHALLNRFKEKTGCGVLLNTSFNVRDEPIIASPEDAFRCFMGTDIDILAIGNCYMKKEDQFP